MSHLTARGERYTGAAARRTKALAQPAQPRGNALAQIHIAKAQLGMDDGTYRDMLWGVARVRSAKDLDHAGRRKVLEHLQACGFKPAPPKTPTPGRPRNIDSADRGPMLEKVEAMLLEAGRAWAYADGIAKRMFGVERVSFCNEKQLHKLVAAMVIDQQRRGGKGTRV